MFVEDTPSCFRNSGKKEALRPKMASLFRLHKWFVAHYCEVPKDPHFRENPLRAVFLNGSVDRGQVYHLTPDILKLRSESNEPITLFIDSPGGDVFAANNIRRLFKSQDQDEQDGVRLITVVRNLAASAAADLLALGDYAIAHSGSTIWYHGTRRAEEEITVEKASELVDDLEKRNADFALRLARAAFRRAVFNYGTLRPAFESVRAKLSQDEESKHIAELECYAHCLSEKLGLAHKKLPMKALKEHESVRSLMMFVFSDLPPDFDKLPRAESDLYIIKRVLEYNAKNSESSGWSLSQNGLKQTVQDFVRLIDFLVGEHRKDIEQLIAQFGTLFLNDDEEWPAYEKFLKSDPAPTEAQKLNYLKPKVQPLLEPLWYFTVCICRLLQHDENVLNPEDAYWLGLVDEVVGSRLPSLRLLLEAER